MKIARLETFLSNSGLRNYLFVRLTTDTGLTGIGEASLEWQEKTVQTLIHEWVEDRVLGVDPFDFEAAIGRLIRDQYQGGPTILTAISGVEIALWDIVGKACGQPVYKLLGGRARENLPAYANGWYGGASTPEQYADRAREVVARGYRAMKFDPFGVAWKNMSAAGMDQSEALHFDWSTPGVLIQEDFAEYDVPWRNDLVCGWNPFRGGEFILPDKPGLGIELDTEACLAHPYKKNRFPSLWDRRWLNEFTQDES